MTSTALIAVPMRSGRRGPLGTARDRWGPLGTARDRRDRSGPLGTARDRLGTVGRAWDRLALGQRTTDASEMCVWELGHQRVL